MPASSSSRSRRPSSSDRDDDGAGGGGNGCTWAATERVASYLQSQRSVHAVCKRHGVNTTAFTPIPAGDRRACSPPPAGSVCVYADALEAGMRVPLDLFCCEVLSHYGVAPSQLSPNCWRILLAAFLALSRAAGVPQSPSVPVFRRFFYLRALKVKGLYCFAAKDTAGVLFTGLPVRIKGWKESFFFLKSPAPWPCPVLWGEPTSLSKKSAAHPVLAADAEEEEESAVVKLLRARGATPIDVLAYLEEDLDARVPKPSRRTTGSHGMDPSNYAMMMQNMRAEKAAAEASAAAKVVAVKSEPGWSWTALSGKKRPAESNQTKEATGHGSASVPPGFSTQPQHARGRHEHDGGDTVEWETARQLLLGVITPSRERAFYGTYSDPLTVIARSYTAMLQAAKAKLAEARELEKAKAGSMGHALKLQSELEKAKAELAEAREAAEAKVMKSAKAAAVQEYLGSKEHERRLEEEALKGYELGMEDMKRVALRLRPDIDAAQLLVAPDSSSQQVSDSVAEPAV